MVRPKVEILTDILQIRGKKNCRLRGNRCQLKLYLSPAHFVSISLDSCDKWLNNASTYPNSWRIKTLNHQYTVQQQYTYCMVIALSIAFSLKKVSHIEWHLFDKVDKASTATIFWVFTITVASIKSWVCSVLMKIVFFLSSFSMLFLLTLYV